MPSYVLDTSAVLCVLNEEDGTDAILRLLDQARVAPAEERPSVLVPFLAMMEVEYRLLRRLDSEEAQRTLMGLEQWPVEVRESTPMWRHEAARIKAQGGLSLADAWVAAFAMMEGAKLVHKDPEFDRVDGLQALRLPDRRT